MDTARPVRRPQAPLPARPTLIRRPQNSQLFRGWGITL